MVFSLFILNSASAKAPKCSALFPAISAKKIEQTIRELSELRLTVDQARAQGNATIAQNLLEKDLQERQSTLTDYLEKNRIMTREELKQEISRTIAELQKKNNRDNKEEDRRSKRHKEKYIRSVIDGRVAIFHRINPGTFKMGETGDTTDVKITEPFEMMATPTTQIIWKSVATLAEKKFPGEFEIDKNPSNYKGDTRPVESATLGEILIWIEALNKLSDESPAELISFMPGHKKGDVYRLPTEAEWEFVVRGRGKYNEAFHFGNDISKVKDYAWFIENSGLRTHSVGEKLPLVIGKKEFFDMLGNVSEMVTDPQVPLLHSDLVMTRGGNISHGPEFMESGSIFSTFQHQPDMNTGFRLVKNAK